MRISAALRTVSLGVVVSATLALAGCAKRADAGASPPEPAAQTAAPKGAASLDTLRASERKIIKNATLTLTVESPSAAARDAAAVAKRFSGYVVEETASGGGDESEPRWVRVSLKVDADRFDDALGELRRMSTAVGARASRART